MNRGAITRKYQPIFEIGSGGMSRVYLTVVRGPGGFNKFQVVKRLLPSLASDPEFLNMFLEEARLSARLNHANVVQINEVGFDGEHHFMAMEYLEGQSLEVLVRRAARQSGLPLELHVRILAEAAAGLHYAHEFADLDGRPLNVVHRDVSPHNVFVTYQGQVKVLDFGIAKAADSALHTRTGTFKGKVAYMAPEQLRQSKSLDRRADIFALGVMLWQAVAGRRFWQNMSDIDIFQQLHLKQIPSLREAKPDAPESLVRVCERALSIDPAGRHATAAEFGDALEAYLAETGRHVSNRELGAFVSDLFASKRAEVQALLEAALTRGSDPNPVPARLPSADPNAPAGDFGPASPHPDAAGGAAAPGRLSQAGDPAQWTVSPPRPPALAAPPPDARPRDRWPWAAAAVLAVGVLGGGLVALNTLRSPPGPAVASASDPVAAPDSAPAPLGSAPAAASASAEAAAAEAPKLTRLLVKATPPGARLFVDDVPLSSNPATATFARDGRRHQVRAEAPGFQGDEKSVVYGDEEEVVSIRLQRETRKAASTRHVPAGKPSAANDPSAAHPPSEPKTEPPKNGGLPIDRDSPWRP